MPHLTRAEKLFGLNGGEFGVPYICMEGFFLPKYDKLEEECV